MIPGIFTFLNTKQVVECRVRALSRRRVLVRFENVLAISRSSDGSESAIILITFTSQKFHLGSKFEEKGAFETNVTCNLSFVEQKMPPFCQFRWQTKRRVCLEKCLCKSLFQKKNIQSRVVSCSVMLFFMNERCKK